MPNPDETLDKVIDDLGVINVPALVEYLALVHPQADALAMAEQIITLIEDSGYTMGND